MKKAYVTPTVEKVEFQYDKAVVASGGDHIVGLKASQTECQGSTLKNGGNEAECLLQ